MLRRSLHKSFFSKCSILPGKFSTGWKRIRKKIIKKNTTKEEENGAIEAEEEEREEREREILRQKHQMNATMFFNLHIFGFFRKQKQLRWAPIHANCKGIV